MAIVLVLVIMLIGISYYWYTVTGPNSVVNVPTQTTQPTQPTQPTQTTQPTQPTQTTQPTQPTQTPPVSQQPTPCIVQGITIPSPWYQNPSNVNQCLAAAGQPCCNVLNGGCMADFTGYSAAGIHQWMTNGCITPTSSCTVQGVTVPSPWKLDPGNPLRCLAPAGQKCCNVLNGGCMADFTGYPATGIDQWMTSCT